MRAGQAEVPGHLKRIQEAISRAGRWQEGGVPFLALKHRTVAAEPVLAGLSP